MAKDFSARVHRRSKRNVFSALIRARFRQGKNKVAIIDADGAEVTYGNLLRGAFAIGSAIARQTKRGEAVGILLPTGAASTIAFFAVLAFGRIPAMLNFTAGAANLEAACNIAKVNKVVTAHKFIEIGGLQDLIGKMEDFTHFLYMDDMRESLTTRDKICAVLGPLLPWFVGIRPRATATGVILFTSGTEGAPKGVVLRHSNLVANVEQIEAHVDVEPSDIIYNPLPTFHCYGLTAGMLWPVLTGKSLVLHPSPLQTKNIAKRISETKPTVMFATDTFLQQYARVSRNGELNSLRIVVCGAERVRDETRHMMQKDFDCEVLEGYGVTEASPVLAANQPGDIKPGTVGTFLPGVEYRLEAVAGLDEGGRLFVRGPNIMAGYLMVDRPGEIQTPEDGWYDTGDIVSLDEHGCIAIRGRAKRFAKIGGEMVSLTVVENCASALWPDHQHTAVILPDPKKGERIVLVTECAAAERDHLITWMKSHGVPPIAAPRSLVAVDEIPVLGTGKTDLCAVDRMVGEHIAVGEQTAASEQVESATETAAE